MAGLLRAAKRRSSGLPWAMTGTAVSASNPSAVNPNVARLVIVTSPLPPEPRGADARARFVLLVPPPPPMKLGPVGGPPARSDQSHRNTSRVRRTPSRRVRSSRWRVSVADHDRYAGDAA